MSVSFNFSAKTFLITGGSSGIGAATVKALANSGANVLIADLNDERCRDWIGDYDGRVVFQPTDMTDPESVKNAFAKVEQLFNGLDGVVNSAGIGLLCPLAETSAEDWKKVIDVDINGVFYGCKEAVHTFRRHNGGVIINIASISGMGGDYGMSAYNAAKAAVINLTKALAMDHSRDGVRSVCVCPGLTQTPMIGISLERDAVREAWLEAIPMNRPGQPEELAQTILFLLSDGASYINGSSVVVDGGLTCGINQPNLPKLSGRFT